MTFGSFPRKSEVLVVMSCQYVGQTLRLSGGTSANSGAAVRFSRYLDSPPFLCNIKLLNHFLGHGIKCVASVISIPIFRAWAFTS